MLVVEQFIDHSTLESYHAVCIQYEIIKFLPNNVKIGINSRNFLEIWVMIKHVDYIAGRRIQ